MLCPKDGPPASLNCKTKNKHLKCKWSNDMIKHVSITIQRSFKCFRCGAIPYACPKRLFFANARDHGHVSLGGFCASVCCTQLVMAWCGAVGGGWGSWQPSCWKSRVSGHGGPCRDRVDFPTAPHLHVVNTGLAIARRILCHERKTARSPASRLCVHLR